MLLDCGAAGTLSAPVRSLHRAAELTGGNYPISTPLKLRPMDGGTAEAPVLWEAIPGEKVQINGGIRVDNWKQEENGSWSAVLPSNFQGTFRSFYVNGKRATRARYPDNAYLRVGKAGNDMRTMKLRLSKLPTTR